MKAYWIRILGAWVLLQFASRVMKSAEEVLRQAADTATIDSTATEVVTTDG
jgi:hypothetical protein